MEKFEQKGTREITAESFARQMNIVLQENGSYTFDPSFIEKSREAKEVFEDFPHVEPDPMLRSEGDTTIFTVAGIQHLETLEREGIVLESQKFQVLQPVIRSQYMDKIKDGYSTSFINHTIVSVGGSFEEFADLCQRMVVHSLNNGGDIEKQRLTVHMEDDRWGNKKFKKMVVTLFYGNKEVSEGLYIDKFPKKDGSNVSVAEVCWGDERFKWIHEKTEGDEKETSHYFEDFKEFYTYNNADTVALIIDPIRTATLMLMQGVEPAHKDPGFRLRQLVKRYVERNIDKRLPADKLFKLSHEFWSRNGVTSVTDADSMYSLLENEMERAYNVYLVQETKKKTGKKIKVNVNQRSKNFINVIKESASDDVVQAINEINQNAYEI